MLKHLRARRDDGGFTLIELLIVIVILGVLASVTVFAVNNITNKGKEEACKAEYKTLEIALEAYKVEFPGDASVDTADLVGSYLRSQPTKYSVVAGDIDPVAAECTYDPDETATTTTT